MNQEQAAESYEITRKFILRNRIGWLRTMAQYMPAVLRNKYLESLDDIAKVAQSNPQ